MIKNILKPLINFWQSKFTKQLLTIGSIAATSGILGWLIYSQWEVLISQLINFRPCMIIYSFLIYFTILVITSIVWADIMNKLSHKVPFRKHFTTFCISALGKRLPGTLWYIAWRSNLYKEDGYSSKLIILTSSIEMIAIVIAAVVVSLLFSLSLISKFTYSLIGFLIIILAILIFLHPKINRKIFQKLKVDFKKFNYKDLIKWTATYIFIWLLNGTLLFSFSNLFADIKLSQLDYFIGAVALTGVLSRLFLFLPTHFGFGEVSLSLLLSGIMPSSLAVVVALSNRIIITFFEILWASFGLVINRVLEKNNPK